ncbi:outer membrane transport energization protein TonB [Bacteroidales bacterium WCE2004]|nr:outer membrane transport energization protein TonB [Bacteroidales bacterium WCE2004]
MQNDQIIRLKRERNAKITGILLSVAAHVCALALVSMSGLKYIYPPPQEQSMLIDFTEAPELLQQPQGQEPLAEEVDLARPVELAQRSESPFVADKPNETPQTQPDPVGDVEVPAPEPKEPALDPRASFPGMSRKDTTRTAPHAAAEAGEAFKAGQPQGNTEHGRTDGKPNAHVEGRSTVGNIPRPVYNVQESGDVIVTIWVDNYGNVVRAVPGGDGTTVTDKALWAAARKAALETHFNMSADAPAMQEGTITYHFKLK